MRLPIACVFAIAGCISHAPPADRGIVLTMPATPPSDLSLPATFKIVTFNVHRVTGDSIARGIALDPKLRDADLIVLEEVRSRGPCGAACIAAKELGLYAAFEPDHVLDDGVLGNAILSRVPLEDVHLVELPKYVSRNSALVATVRIGGQPVTLYAVHLTDQLSTAERLTQMRPILEDARKRTTPVIIAGDFNTSANFFFHNIPIRNGHAIARFEALLRSYGFASPTANTGPTFRVFPMKLDSFYTRGFDTHHFGTTHGHDISDHLALWAMMSLRSQVASQ
jgi:endonuclease/exonuclease/phosphatase family metal-dependent hydrolase